MSDKPNFRLIRDHDAAESWHEWVLDQARPTVTRDTLGRENASGRWTVWGFLRCNNLGCHADAMYRTDAIEQAAESWHPCAELRSKDRQ